MDNINLTKYFTSS